MHIGTSLTIALCLKTDYKNKREAIYDKDGHVFELHLS